MADVNKVVDEAKEAKKIIDGVATPENIKAAKGLWAVVKGALGKLKNLFKKEKNK